MSMATCANATFVTRMMAPNVNPNFIMYPQSAYPSALKGQNSKNSTVPLLDLRPYLCCL